MSSSAKHPVARSAFFSTKRRRDGERRRFRKVMFEALEDRRVLATFPAPITSWQAAEFVNNEVLFKTSGNLTEEEQRDLDLFLNLYAAAVVQEWEDFGLTYVRSANNWTRDETISFAQALHNFSFVEYAEPNFIRQMALVPDDPFFPAQWWLENIGQPSPYPFPNPAADPPFGTIDADIDATEAWDVSTGSPNTVIAIVDSGVDYTHPDLADRIWENPIEVPDGIDNDGNGFIDDVRGWDTFDLDSDPADENGHGTHVAGTSAAIGNNGIGVAGVSWNSQIMILKAANAAGGLTTASIVGAQVYIHRMKTQFGVNVVASNNSYGALGAAAFSFAEFDSIRRLTEAGVVFVAASGNNGLNIDGPTIPFFPAAYNIPGIISVGATDRNDELATFSNYGLNNVDLAAPGVAIYSTFPTNLPPGFPQPPFPPPPLPPYGYSSGTSMASPVVAGAVAILRSVDPSLSNADVKDLLMSTVDTTFDLGFRVKSAGRLNLARALDELSRNQINGTVWRDFDGDGNFDASESGLAGVTIYVDRNNNNSFDTSEPSTVSLADGTYNLRATLGAGTFTVREVVPAGYRQTFPNQAAGFEHLVILESSDDVVDDIDFGNQPLPGSIDGLKYLDIDMPGNTLGVRDLNEPGLEGFVIYVDVNNDGLIGIGEPAAITDSQGRFRINNVLPGTYTVREVPRPGYVQTEPAGGAGVTVIVIGNQITFGVLFGNRAAIDWGDAPASYGTLSASNGARHGLLTGFFLGDASDTTSPHIDDEANGIPTPDADGDDNNNAINDEDGVQFLTPLVPGQPATIRVDVSSGGYGSGFLQGWIDFNNDGDFLDAGEQILTDRTLTTGTHMFTFTVPATAAVADTFARFRWSLQRGLGPTGPAVAGEVEDYSTAARAVSPTANDDGPFLVGQDSNFIDNEFDVLANDFPGVGGEPFFILSADATSVQGGLVQVDFVNNVIRYQPPADYVGTDSFQYIISDGIHPPSNPGTVFINVVPLNSIAIDDSFNIATGSASVPLNVLANDIQGINGPLNIVAVGPRSAGGTVVNNGTSLAYTPFSPSFQGSDTFTYTISDGVQTSQATVHVQVGGPASNQIVQIEYRAFNALGQELGTSGVPVPSIGDVITLSAFTRDLRGSFPDPILPLLIPDASGVLGTYADVLYDRSIVRPVSANNPFGIDITFGPIYDGFQTGTSSTPGIVDEVGATDTDLTYEGPGDHLLFSIRYNVRGNGTMRFFANPFENTPNPNDFEFETNVRSNVDGQIVKVDNEDVFFVHSLPFQVGPNSEGEATNLFNPLDVNQDTIVSVNDAMLVVNHLNRFGAGPYSPMLSAALGQGLPQYFLDVSGDGRVSAFDAKLVVDHLNWKATQALSASPEGESADALVLGPTTTRSTSSAAAGSDADGDYAQNVDQVLADDLGGSAITAAVADPSDDLESESDEDEEQDDIFANW